MSDSNALLIKLKISKFRELAALIARDFDVFDLDHQIYVPNRFVLGHFKDRKDGFKLSQSGIFYRDSSEILEEYQEDIDDEKMEVVRRLLLPESVLEIVAQQGREYKCAKKQFVESVKSVDQYLV